MANNYFKFKQFIIYQDKTAMKVGTDGVLLGAYVCNKIKNPDNILDIVTGSGLLALMFAFEYNSEIHAIEIDKNSYIQAKNNFIINNKKIKLFNCSLNEYLKLNKNSFELIVCNPPFFDNS